MLMRLLVVRMKISKGGKKPVKNLFSNYKRVSHLGKQGLLSTPSPTPGAAEGAGGPMGNEMARLGPVPGPDFLPSAEKWRLQA